MTGRSWLPTWKQALVALGAAALLLILFDSFVVESVVVPSASMVPAILPNERVFLTRWPRPPIERFSVVVLDSREVGRRLAKRVIALPGERVRVEDGWRVVIDGKPLEYSPPGPQQDRMEAGDHLVRVAAGGGEVPGRRFGDTDLTLGPDEYFVLGDNRLASEDSRAFGPVKRDEIQGTLGAVWYSFDLELGRLRSERLFQTVRP